MFWPLFPPLGTGDWLLPLPFPLPLELPERPEPEDRLEDEDEEDLFEPEDEEECDLPRFCFAAGALSGSIFLCSSGSIS